MSNLKSLEHFPNVYLDLEHSKIEISQKESVLFVLDSLTHVFNLFLPLNGAERLIIALDQDIPCPVCYKLHGQIKLKAQPQKWNQLAYQFAHELCHYLIPAFTPANLGWLEESICEMSSYYFLPKISKYWKRINANKCTSEGEPYYPYFTSYVESEKMKAQIFDISQLCHTPAPSVLKELESDEYIRDKNSHIANCILPIFKKRYLTWHAVPYLGNIKANQTLTDSLKEWIELSPQESRAGLIEIAHLFGASESLL